MNSARAVAIVIAIAALSGCATANSLAVKGVASTLSEGGDTVRSHDDPDLIAGAMPFALMLHESLLASVPTHEPLLTTTCSLFTQYAFGFVAADAEDAAAGRLRTIEAAQRPRVQARGARTALLLARTRSEVSRHQPGAQGRSRPCARRARRRNMWRSSTGLRPHSARPSRPAASTTRSC